MSVERCPTCGGKLPAGSDGCPRCLLRLGVAAASTAMPERLGSYEILSRLGQGGMGEVYRAHDARLDREIAIKVLPDLLVGNPERTARFQREARVAASLNHRNIAAVYGFEEEDGAHFLVMELVPGTTLAERLGSGPLPIDEALALVAHIADGLEAAHESGVVHRDLKPGNVKITPAGQPKILDFGLAKVLEEPAPDATEHESIPGMVFGTVPYMSPEQARGRALDKRSDIWALGCVLYECLSGKRAFDGDSASDVVAKILERDPDWTALPARTPPRVRELLERCLEKDPRKRMRDAGDVRIELERALAAREWTSSGIVRAAEEERSSSRGWAWAAAGVGLAAVLATVWIVTAGEGREDSSGPAAPMHVLVADPDVPRASWQETPTVAISPDGQTIVYVGKGPEDTGDSVGLYVRRADGIRARRLELPCHRVFNGPAPSDPFFSPDGRSLGFTCGNLYRIPLAGGNAVPIVESAIPMKGATWSPRGIIFSPAAKAGLVLVKDSGGPLETLTVPDAAQGEVSHRWPYALPDGRHVLFTIKKEGLATFDQGEIALLDLETLKYKTLVRGGTFARYLPSGHIVLARGSMLLGVGFDLERGQVQGTPVSLVEGVMTEPGSGAAQYAVAPETGALVFVPGGSNVLRTELAWIDRNGVVTPIGAPLQHYDATSLSRDGTRLASTVYGATDTIAIYDLVRGSLSRLPTEGNCAPIGWSPDGRQILYTSDRDGLALLLRNADGTGTPRRLTVDPGPIPSAMLLAELPQGLGLVHASDGNLLVSPLSGNGTPQSLPLGATSLALSRDGRWLAYSSDVSGRSEIYVTPFPTGSPSWQVSRGGGLRPFWAEGNGELFYVRGSGDDRWATSARLAIAPDQLSAAVPVDLFKLPQDAIIWAVHPDGERFVMTRPIPPAFKGDRVEAILGWSREVEARTSGR